MAELQWFITEQVEEEKTVREIVAKFQMVKNDPASLLDLDRELGGRQQTAEAKARTSELGSDCLLASSVAREALEDAAEAGERQQLDDRDRGVATSFRRPPWRLTVTCAAMSSPSRVLSM